MELIRTLTVLTVTFIILLLLTTYSAFAQSKDHYPVGKVAQIEGHVFYSMGDNRRKMKLGDPIFLHSKIETQKDSKVLILFVDDTQLTLAQNTELMIDEYVFDPYDSEENEAAISVTEGAFNWLSGQITKRDRPQVDIKTPVGSIGIRGTEFWSGEFDGGYGIYVSDGLVGFEGEAGSAEMPEGEGIYIPSEHGAEINDEYWDSMKIDDAIETVTFNDQARTEDLLKQALRDNVQERENYRSAVFPHKSKPSGRAIIDDIENKFTDEFNELQDRR